MCQKFYKHFTSIISFNLHNDPCGVDTVIILIFTDEELGITRLNKENLKLAHSHVDSK